MIIFMHVDQILVSPEDTGPRFSAILTSPRLLNFTVLSCAVRFRLRLRPLGQEKSSSLALWRAEVVACREYPGFLGLAIRARQVGVSSLSLH